MRRKGKRERKELVKTLFVPRAKLFGEQQRGQKNGPFHLEINRG